MKDKPAFPTQNWPSSNGMALRDYFAAKAVQGLLASEVNAPLKVFAIRAYAVADAMMEARDAAQ
jgi:hypothetical protein